MTEQYRRKWSLVVSNTPGSVATEGIDLAELRIQFYVQAADSSSPNTLQARVYNPAKTTADRIQNEFTHVALQAGYEGNVAVIFEGNIKQVHRGRESAIDTYIDIFAGDGDEAHNFAVVNKTIQKATLLEQTNAIRESMQPYGVKETQQVPNELGTGGVVNIRGKVLWGMARERMAEVADAGGCSWSIQNGVLTLIPTTGYLPGEAVVLNSQTGLLLPVRATDNGIEMRCLLNPRIKIGTRVQIDNRSINTITVREQGFPRYGSLLFPANVSNDGFYRVLVAEHRGDNRGNEWHTLLTCLAVDPSSPAGASVLPAG